MDGRVLNPTDLLTRLEAEGVNASLNLKLEANTKPSDDTRALIRDNRDALLEHLAAELVRNVTHGLQTQDGSKRQRVADSPTSQQKGVTLYGVLLLNLMVWIARYHELNVEHPNGVTLNAKPEQVAQHLTCSVWCVLYDETKTVLASAGNVPARALKGKTALEPTQYLAKSSTA